MTNQREMKLGAFFMVPGHHVAAWRHPNSEINSLQQLSLYKKLATTAERGLFDMIFFADGYALNEQLDTAVSQSVAVRPDPLVLLSALAAVTEKIGLTATVSTTFNEPFHVARKFASLDHISGGRAAWNVVTSSRLAEARNFNQEEHLQHTLRYERAEEFVEVAKKLWDSWEDDALILNKERAEFAAPSKVHAIYHKGTHFSVQGPLNVSRPVQGHPVVVQAGSSESGKELAAKTAEVIFTAWQTLEEAQSFYRDIKQRLTKYGRSANQLKIMPGVFPIIGKTEKEAREKQQYLRELIPEKVGVGLLSALINVDLSPYSVDGPLPSLPEVTEINGAKSRFQLIKDLAEREHLTIKQLYGRIAGARGHREIFGTASQIADQMQEWFENGAADGFNVMPPFLPDGLEDFVDQVIPELQERGLFRTEYTGSTLREHLELERPISQYAKPKVQKKNVQ
ncbi:nitrilotriacetate monooxygenase [Alkalihalobacillus alcalophilus ATCC 27647 = CGMCC 1.3604]|uniref:Nitrilotriacetate monooxygenase n=1 Tax=Alkalihalobacillus alcalophilus ATCC 27647 = CGMCC 1.3604 TaxID=1218173 RepID=A0A094WLR6_ALKAL|nr:LLM class flavin-dependent oxidoreductase [Alkalihalobacillus alcalophilus]KGA98694.1 nitrilotriacetate monooxygenase [Alkalihalobacillus alcalophilus ATCC 27647 = CGMCC 1.3604]MED1560320.1 LLM class flavin-dependent oxidoreductase [Alkalihalobacillus alcalophilus]